MATKARQFALPHTTTYSLVNSFYAGALLDGGGCACQNCGRVVTQVGVVRNAEGTEFNVGMDCAATLGGITAGQLFDFGQGFDILKNLTAGIRKDRKTYGEALTLHAGQLLDGGYYVEGRRPRRGAEGTEMLFRKYFTAEVYEKFLVPGSAEVAALVVTPAPTVYGTEATDLVRGAHVVYDGQPVRVMDVRANLEFPASKYKQTVLLTKVAKVVALDDPKLVVA